ncbi:MAG: Serine/threonine protein kinase [Myxococcales bacterium]|nr:Serine/threonine protein kinase [Myxococcales bacterium]
MEITLSRRWPQLMRSVNPSAGIAGPEPALPRRGFPWVSRGTHTAQLPGVRAQATASDLTGTVVGGYRLDRRIGGSARAQVYYGRHAQLGRAAAIKILNPDLALDEEAMSRFFCEARAVAELGCEHLVEVYDFVFEPRKERVAYIMEYLAGDDLRRSLDRTTGLPPHRAARIAAQLCDALAAAHAYGVVHRDVRPGNIMLVRRGGEPEFVKLIDFGVAQFAGQVKHHTAAGNVLGNPLYMSPEAARGQRVDGRADLYSVGVVLYEMLTGIPPFRAVSQAALIDQHLHQKAPSVAGDHGHGETPRQLVDIVRRCLQKSPDDRFEDAESLRAALLEASYAQADIERTAPMVVPDDGLSRRFVRHALRLRASRTAALVAGSTIGLAAGYWLALALR